MVSVSFINILAGPDRSGLVQSWSTAISEVDIETESFHPVSGNRMVSRVVGHDREAVSKQVPHTFGELKGNVAGSFSAPLSGERIFGARASITTLDGAVTGHVQHSIEFIAQDLAVTLSQLED